MLILLSGGESLLSSYLDTADVITPAFVDIEQHFFRDYRVLMNPSYFVVNSRGQLVKMGAGERNEEEYLALLEEASD